MVRIQYFQKSQRIILRYLSNFFGSRLVVPEYSIDELGQNHVPPQCDFYISDRKKKYFWTKPISKLLTTSLESLYCQEYSTITDNISISTIDIVVGGDHGQSKFCSVSKFILRDLLFNKLNSCVIKNTHIDCDKDIYDVLNDSIVKPLNEEMKLLMKKYMFVYFMWNEDKKLIIKYSKEEDINKPIYKKIINSIFCLKMTFFDNISKYTKMR